MQLQKRLAALEAMRTPITARWFTGYQTGRFYEAGSAPVDYRSGINNAPEAGPAYTDADIEALRGQGQPVNVIDVCYIDLRTT